MRNFRRVTPVRDVSLIVIFVLFSAAAFFAQAPPASEEDWSTAARALERKIAEKLKPGQGVTLSFQNMSTLSPDEAASIREEIEMELRAQGAHVKPTAKRTNATSEEGVAEIRATLAENSQGLLWVAEIRQGDNSEVVMLQLPRAERTGNLASTPAMLLRSQKVFEQEAPILSLTPLGERGAEILKLSSHAVEAYSVAKIEVKGKPMQIEAGIDGLARLYKSDDQRAAVATFSGWGSDLAGIKSGCGSGWQVLVTRAGDWTERDAVQAFEIEGKQAVAVSPALEFAGPVLVLQPSENKDTGLAVVRNLQTGRYEAHVLSLSCSR